MRNKLSIKLFIGLFVIILAISITFGCDNIISMIKKSPNGTYIATSGQTFLGIATTTITFTSDTLTIIGSNPITGQMREDYKYDFIIYDEIITEDNIAKYDTITEEQLRVLREKLDNATTQSVRDSIRSDMSDLIAQSTANMQKMRAALRLEERRRDLPSYKPSPSYILLYHTTAENATLIGLNNIITKEVKTYSFKYIQEQDIVIIDEIPFYK